MKDLHTPWRLAPEEKTVVVNRHGQPVGGFVDPAYAKTVVECVNAQEGVLRPERATYDHYQTTSHGHRPGRAL